MQDSYFIYDYINFVKELFITGLNKFISIYGSVIYFDEKKTGDCLTSENTCV